MTWRRFIWGLTLVANVAFAALVFSTRSHWGPNDYIGGTLLIAGPLLGVVALLAAGPPEK